MNLFDENKQGQSTPKKEKVKISVQDIEVLDKIAKLEKLTNEIKNAKLKADIISSELKEYSQNKWLDLYDSQQENPGTVIFQSENEEEVGQFLLVPQDRYSAINKEKANELISEYGEDIVEVETSYTFDPKMVEKYSKVISQLIMNSSEIEDDDKRNIIVANSNYKVAKGTIDNLSVYGDVYSVFEDTKPVFSIKNPKIINLE